MHMRLITEINLYGILFCKLYSLFNQVNTKPTVHTKYMLRFSFIQELIDFTKYARSYLGLGYKWNVKAVFFSYLSGYNSVKFFKLTKRYAFGALMYSVNLVSCIHNTFSLVSVTNCKVNRGYEYIAYCIVESRQTIRSTILLVIFHRIRRSNFDILTCYKILSSNESRTDIGVQHLFTFVSCIPTKYKILHTSKSLHSYKFKLAAKHL
jgi:hypothetical protein